MPHIHLIEGPVGAGKSTFACQLARETNGIHIALDQWFTRLFSPDRPTSDVIHWYIERKDRLILLIWNHSQAILASGKDVILELGLIQRQARYEFYDLARLVEHGLSLYVLDAPREVRRERVKRRNLEHGDTFAMIVPEDMFEMASDLWEPPDECECNEITIQFIGDSA